MMTALVESTIKISLIVLVALALTILLRNRSAALRHWVLAVGLVCAAATPVLVLIIPSWYVPLGTSGPVSRIEQGLTDLEGLGQEPTAYVQPQGSTARESESSDTAPRMTARAALLITWIAGLCVSLATLIVGGARLSRIASRARRVVDGPSIEIAEHIARMYSIRRPVVLLQSDHPRLLVTWGLLRPKVILPAGAREWSEDRIRLVLYHELAHVRRRDWIVQLAAELLRAVHWFNPLVWMASARLRQESEHACDDAVLDRGVDGSEYATHLVEIARDLGQRRMWIPAPAIVRTPSLERRVKAMLDHRLNRRPVSRLSAAATFVAMLAVTVFIAGLAAAQTAFSTMAGSIVDPTNGALPGVTLVLTNVQTNAKYELQSDRTGRYEFVGLPPGDYQLETRLPGFARFQSRVTVAGQNVQQDLTLQVGSLEETVTVVGGPSDNDRPAPADPEKERLLEEKRLKREATRCPGTLGADSNRIGGNIRAPMKIVDVRPHYPPSLQASGIEGTVVLQGRIGTGGSLEELNVMSSPNIDLANAASEAVGQWRFDATLLNCVAVEVAIKVTVNFRYRP